MFVLTVDQVDSRHRRDQVDDVAAWLRARFGGQLLAGPDRTAGDEFQVVPDGAATALAVALDLARDGDWSVGIGVGTIETPLPATTREARGGAFAAARDAVDRAKRAPLRFAVTAERADAADAEALVGLLLDLRARRSEAGWQVADRLADGATQARVAADLRITPQAVSLRARTAAVRTDEAAVPALVRALAALDGAAGEPGTATRSGSARSSIAR